MPKINRKTGPCAAGSTSTNRRPQQVSRLPCADQPLEYLFEPSQLRRYAAQAIGGELSQPAPMIGAVAEVGQRIELRRQNRLNRSLVSSENTLRVLDGVLALEAVPAGGRRQILDFLMPDDTIPAAIAVTFSGFFLRALTNASLESRSAAASVGTPESCPETSAMLRKLRSHLMRRNLHQIMIGQLDSRITRHLVSADVGDTFWAGDRMQSPAAPPYVAGRHCRLPCDESRHAEPHHDAAGDPAHHTAPQSSFVEFDRCRKAGAAISNTEPASHHAREWRSEPTVASTRDPTANGCIGPANQKSPALTSQAQLMPTACSLPQPGLKCFEGAKLWVLSMARQLPPMAAQRFAGRSGGDRSDPARLPTALMQLAE